MQFPALNALGFTNESPKPAFNWVLSELPQHGRIIVAGGYYDIWKGMPAEVGIVSHLSCSSWLAAACVHPEHTRKYTRRRPARLISRLGLQCVRGSNECSVANKATGPMCCDCDSRHCSRSPWPRSPLHPLRSGTPLPGL